MGSLFRLERRKSFSLLVSAIIFCSFLFIEIAPAFATNTIECRLGSCRRRCSQCCTVGSVQQITEDAFDRYRKNFIMNSFYTNTVEPSFKKLTDEVRNVGVFKTGAYGAFFDASILIDTLRDLQISSVKTLQTYAPSEQICRFGTLSRSLSASDARVDANRLVLSEVGLSRSLGTMSSVASAGRGLDNENRLRLFVDNFCDLSDNNSGLTEICQVATPVIDLTQNRDIDFTRALDDTPTINADFTDVNRTVAETNTIALSHYLYGHRQPSKRISATDFNESSGSTSLYREYRSIFARRAAAQNSYNTLAASKSAGSGSSDAYMTAVLTQLGVSADDANKYLGDKNTQEPVGKSSYNAQMELLTKKLYQDPAFYANLMDSKSNVRRTSASIQGIGLMQDRDIYRSMTRSEMLLGLLVQMEARNVVNNNQNLKGQGR